MLKEDGGMYEFALSVQRLGFQCRDWGFQWSGMLEEVVGSESRRKSQ